MSDMEAFEMFKAIRWNETNEDVVCPCCGSIKKSISMFIYYFFRAKFIIRFKNLNCCINGL